MTSHWIGQIIIYISQSNCLSWNLASWTSEVLDATISHQTVLEKKPTFLDSDSLTITRNCIRSPIPDSESITISQRIHQLNVEGECRHYCITALLSSSPSTISLAGIHHSEQQVLKATLISHCRSTPLHFIYNWQFTKCENASCMKHSNRTK